MVSPIRRIIKTHPEKEQIPMLLQKYSDPVTRLSGKQWLESAMKKSKASIHEVVTIGDTTSFDIVVDGRRFNVSIQPR
jgi:hypothetical protein